MENNIQKTKKIAILIAVRMKSSRLPKKALLKIEGRPALAHLLDRMKLSKIADSVVVCTSTNPQDEVLGQVAKENRVKVFFGSENDVLERFIGAADREGAEIVVRVTGDNILVDPIFLDKMVEYHLKNGAEYTWTESLPSGVKCEVMEVSALKKILELAEAPENSEYMTWYFTKNPDFFKIAIFSVPENLARPNFRLTMDEPKDYELLKAIFKNLYREGEVFLWPEIVEFLDKNPEILKINAGVNHKDFARMEKDINIKLKKLN